MADKGIIVCGLINVVLHGSIYCKKMGADITAVVKSYPCIDLI